MKVNNPLHIGIFLMAFLVPQILIFLFSWLFMENKKGSLFLLDLKTEQEIMFFKFLAEEMQPTVGIHTVQIFASNLFVSLVLWAAVISIYFLFYRHKDRRTNQLAVITFKVAYVACFFFFFKEGIRVGLTVLDFYQTMNMPYLATIFTLIMPHAIFEFMAFILIAIFALNWLNENIYQYRFYPKKPSVISVALPLVLILASALVETTLTPVIFNEFILLSV